DKGYLLVNIQLPDAAAASRTRSVMGQVETIAHGIPGVAHTVGISGTSVLLGANAPNFASMYVMLDGFDKRRGPGLSGDEIAAELRTRCRERVRDGTVGVFGAPPIDGLGTAGGFKLMIEDRGNLGLMQLQQVTDAVVARGRKNPELQGLFTSSRVETPW